MTAPTLPAPATPPVAVPAVSVVVCTRDGAGRIGPALASVRASLDDAAAHGVPAELVLVDSASADGTRAVLDAAAAEDPRVRVVAVGRPGLSRARNAGGRAARGRAVLFTDDDVRVPPHWVRSTGSASVICASETSASASSQWSVSLAQAKLASASTTTPSELARPSYARSEA